MRNIRLLIAYDGTDFHGWQRQPNAPTVQDCLESAIARVLGERVQVWGSGRTDAGVHALKQVANFNTSCAIPCENLMKALNNTLPPTVRIKDTCEVSARFHARYDARSKTYRYRILQAPVCSPFLWRFVWHYPFQLDIEQMAEAAKLFEGEHDFTSFAAADGCKAEKIGEGPGKHPRMLHGDSGSRGQPAAHRIEAAMVRRIFASRLFRRAQRSLIIYEVSGNGFLHHMVRNIVGTLVEVGEGKLAPGEILEILKARDRTRAGPTAPAQGLCLMKVQY